MIYLVIPLHEIHVVIFQQVNTKDVRPDHIYRTLAKDFNDVLKTLKMDERKEGMLRRKVTLNSFRRFVKTVISTQVNQDYSEWFLGHAKSTYWTMKEPQRREVYSTKCMKYLTFLDYSVLEVSAKNTEEQLKQEEKEIDDLRWDVHNRGQTIDHLEKEIAALKDNESKYNAFVKSVNVKLKSALDQVQHTKQAAKIINDSLEKKLAERKTRKTKIK
jgi:hypothetical protein